MFAKSNWSIRTAVSQMKVLYHFKRPSVIKTVRVRFAPSPTGQLHLGGLRTALYNYLFARSRRGKFILRIEDTDQTRIVPGATERIIESLRWAGIEIDDGPGFGGPNGTYIQSQRQSIYQNALDQLLMNGSAYPCFCTERRLEMLRKEAARTRQIPRYDNKCRHLTRSQIEELLDKGTPYCVRFRLSNYLEPFYDLIYGKVEHNVAETEGDPVIMKSDKFPTYHFANVVDDHLMGITHVLRGVEWQISTTKHLLLYKAFNWQPPKFGHLPLLVNADGSKLSKRQGDIGVEQFRDRGYYPLALVNYVVSAGGGFQRSANQKQQMQLYTMPELVNQFNIDLVNSHPSRLNPDILEDLNRLQIQNSLKQSKSTYVLIEEVRKLVKQRFPNELQLDLSDEHVRNVIQWSSNRLTFTKDLCTPELSFLWVRPSESTPLLYISKVQLESLIKLLRSHDFSKAALNSTLKTFSESEKIKFADLMQSLRAVLSGLKEGPGVAEMMHILGRKAVLQRLRVACDRESFKKDQCKLVKEQ